MEQRFETVLSSIETACASIRDAAGSDDWERAGDTNGNLEAGLQALDRLIEEAVGGGRTDLLGRVQQRLERATAAYRDVCRSLKQARDATSAEISQARFGRKAVSSYLDTASASMR